MVMPTIMQPMYLNELYGAMLPGVKKIACGRVVKGIYLGSTTTIAVPASCLRRSQFGQLQCQCDHGECT